MVRYQLGLAFASCSGEVVSRSVSKLVLPYVQKLRSAVRSDFNAERDAVSWALGFAAHECLSARNWRARRREDLGDERWRELPSHALTPEETVIMRDLREAAIDAVHQLRDEDAEVIEAAVRGERPNASAGVSALFRKRLQRALARLRVIWRNKYDVD